MAEGAGHAQPAGRAGLGGRRHRDAADEEEKLRAYTEAQIAFVKGAANASAVLQAGDSAGRRLELSQTLVDAGFSRFDIRSDGRIDVGADVALHLSPGGELALAGRQVYVAGDISAPNGKISLTSRDMSTAAGLFPTESDAKYSTLIVDQGASLSTAGQWVNDYLDRQESSRKAKAIGGGTASSRLMKSTCAQAASSTFPAARWSTAKAR